VQRFAVARALLRFEVTPQPRSTTLKLSPILHLALATLLTAGAAGVAHAQPGGSETPAGPEVDLSVKASQVDQGVANDPNMDSAWLAPTGFTMPKGKWAFHDHELFFIGMSYGVTDRLQLSATTLVPVTSDQGLFAIFSGKAQIIRQGRVRLALHGALNTVTNSEDSVNALTLGGALSLCLDASCDSALNAYAGTGIALEDGQSELPLLLSASVIKKVSSRVKLVAEIDTGMIVGGERADAYLGWYGLRFHNKNMAADIGFMKPFGPALDGEDVFPIGFPWLKFTYRGG
jgi:hypothetical protein